MKTFSDKPEIYNILFSQNYDEEFTDFSDKKICPNDPTVYIYISSKFNKKDALDGHENWYVMINALYIVNQNWEDEIKRSRKIIKDFILPAEVLIPVAEFRW